MIEQVRQGALVFQGTHSVCDFDPSRNVNRWLPPIVRSALLIRGRFGGLPSVVVDRRRGLVASSRGPTLVSRRHQRRPTPERFDLVRH